MSLYIPSEVANIIFEYYAQIRDLKWTPSIDIKTGKLKWKTNKYSAKYDNMNKLMKHRNDNIYKDISLSIHQIRGHATINYYNTFGTIIYLKKTHYVNRYQIIVAKSTIYVEFIDEHGFKNSFFYSTELSLRKSQYDVYQDGNIHSILYDFDKCSELFDNEYSLVIEKY